MMGIRFTIDSLPRTGSTSLARMLSSHAEVSCLIEPFHPSRYQGQYHNAVHDSDSLRMVLELIWLRWSGIKHVWQVPGHWPFGVDADVNQEIIRYSPAVIYIERKNYLQRYVSSVLSQRVRFWIGSRHDFVKRLERTGLPEFDVETARRSIETDRKATATRRRLINEHTKSYVVSYEQLFGYEVSKSQQLHLVNQLLAFLEYSPLTPDDTAKDSWIEATDARISKWNGPEIYERIPGVDKLEDRLGCAENGWLFK